MNALVAALFHFVILIAPLLALQGSSLRYSPKMQGFGGFVVGGVGFVQSA